MNEALMPIWMEDQYLKTEQYIIGAMLAESNCVDTVRSKVSEDMFRSDIDRGLFRAICELQDEGTGVDIATVGARFKENGGVWNGDYLSEIVQAACTASDVSVYCDLLAKENVRRDIYYEMQSWIRDIESGVDPISVATAASQKMEEVCGDGEVNKREIEYGEAIQDLMCKASDSQEGKTQPTIPCGYNALDRILGGGFQSRGMYVLAARPGKGKTAMAINIAKKIASAGKKVLFISLEMGSDQLVARMVSSGVGRVSPTEILNGTFEASMWGEITDYATRTQSLPIVFSKKFQMGINDIRSMAIRSKPEFIIIDYLGLVENENEAGSIYQETTKKSRRIKEMACSFDCPILCLAQLNRESEKRGNGKPMLSDLRDSGSIEQDADAVLFNWIEGEKNEDGYSESEESNSAVLKIIVAKNRHGRTGIVPMYWDKVTGKITELQTNGAKGNYIPF